MFFSVNDGYILEKIKFTPPNPFCVKKIMENAIVLLQCCIF